MKRTLTIVVFCVALIAGGTTTSFSANADELAYNGYADTVNTYWDTMDDIVADAEQFGWSKAHVDEAIVTTARLIADISEMDIPDCIDEDRMLLIDLATSNMAISAYYLYLIGGEAGEPLTDNELDIFFRALDRPYEAWQTYTPVCS